MNPQWQLNSLAIPMGISFILIVVFLILGIRQRRNPLSIPYIFFMFCLLIWMSTSLIENITLNLELSLFMADLSFLGTTFLPIGWLGIVMTYNGRGLQFRRLIPVLVVIPILTNLIIWTNSLHGIWRGDPVRNITSYGFPVTDYDYGAWFNTVHVTYSLGITFLAMFLLVHALVYRQRMYRMQIILMLVALNLPIAVDILHRLHINLIPNYNASTLVFPISALLIGWVVLRLRFLDITPIARDLVVESMQDLMVVVDTLGRIVDINPSAHLHLFNGQTGIIGGQLNDYLPFNIKINNFTQDKQTREITIKQGKNNLIYEMRVSSINDSSGQFAGNLFLLRDITSQKQTEQANQDQLQQITILEERQRLARELHDSVSQTLFAARTLADLLTRAIDKRPDKIYEYAVNIQQLIVGTSAEMRLILMELYPDALVSTELGILIRHLCDAFTGATGIPVDFSASPQVILDKDTQLTFYRIAQESLNNINKHAGATNIIVELSKDDAKIELVIQDNGSGFDLDTIPSDHFGVKNMMERANMVGAQLNIQTNQSGTTIVLRIGQDHGEK